MLLNSYTKKITILFLLCLLSSVGFAKEKKDDLEPHKVTKVLAANILELDNKEIVRLVGVDPLPLDSTKEINKQWAEKAKAFSEALVLDNEVMVEYPDEKPDEEGRKWAYVFFFMKIKKASRIVDQGMMPFWKGTGNYMLNRMLIEYGYANTKSPFSFRFRSQFMELEKHARNRQVGMWEDLAH